MIEIQLSNFDAGIFDMDGTMINNMPYHQAAWTEFIKRHNFEVNEDEFRKHTSGKKNSLIFEFILGRPLGENELSQLTKEKESIYRELYRPHLQEIRGLRDAINKISGKLPLAVATTAPQENRQMCLDDLSLNSVFKVILGDEHVDHGKPNPEIYLKTAEALRVSPNRCLVFEDTPSGVKSAKKAGMTVVGITSSHSQEDLHNADWHLGDYTEIKFLD